MQTVTSDNSAVLFLDLQDNLVAGVRTVGRHKLRRTVGALAGLCALHELPAFVSAIPPGGHYLKNVTGPLGDAPIRKRTFTTAFADAQLVADVKASGRSVLVLAGVASEIVVLQTALDAIGAGYTVHIAIDGCGGFSERTESAAWSRATAAGAVMTSVVTIAAELAGDFTSEAGAKTLALMYDAVGK